MNESSGCNPVTLVQVCREVNRRSELPLYLVWVFGVLKGTVVYGLYLVENQDLFLQVKG